VPADRLCQQIPIAGVARKAVGFGKKQSLGVCHGRPEVGQQPRPVLLGHRDGHGLCVLQGGQQFAMVPAFHDREGIQPHRTARELLEQAPRRGAGLDEVLSGMDVARRPAQPRVEPVSEITIQESLGIELPGDGSK